MKMNPRMIIVLLNAQIDPETYWLFERSGEWYQAHYGIKYKEWFNHNQELHSKGGEQGDLTQHPDDICDSCKYKLQACSYFLDGQKFEDACIEKQRELRKGGVQG